MPVTAAALSGLAGVSFGLMLLGVAGVAFCIWSLSRLRQDCRVIEAAERMEGVNLRHVIRRYVPRALRSHHRADEILLAKQIIEARQPWWKRWAIASAVLVICSAATTALVAHRNLQATTMIRVAGTPVHVGDVLTLIQGVWGWRSDSLRSCSENPQSISVSLDHKRLSVHYMKPIAGNSALDFDIVSVRPDTIVLSAPRLGVGPISIFIKFLTADTYMANNSAQPLQTTGVIERCR
jgi:hypothetical protein